MTESAGAVHWKLVVDAADPHALADFWAAALRYLPEDNGALVEKLLDAGAVPAEATSKWRGRPAWRNLAAVRHPEDPYDEGSGTGLGRRLLPEPKTGKNRLHIALHPGEGLRGAEVERLTALGARVLREVREQGGVWTVMYDPEGNEFCVH
jgi:hypothetical protein